VSATVREQTRPFAELPGGAVLPDCAVTDGTLAGVALYGADLSGATLSGAILRGTNLRGADLSDADLTGADLTGATSSAMPAPAPSQSSSIRWLSSGGSNRLQSYLTVLSDKHYLVPALESRKLDEQPVR